MLLENAHGTGNVLHQVLRMKAAQAFFRTRQCISDDPRGNSWKNTTPAANCTMGGAQRTISNGTLAQEMLTQLGAVDLNQLRKVSRIISAGQKFYSSDYTRMQRRACNVVLLRDGRCGFVQFFVFRVDTHLVYAVMYMFRRTMESSLSSLRAGMHLHAVERTDDCLIVPVEALQRTLVYLCIDEGATAFVTCAPNRHGHSIFK